MAGLFQVLYGKGDGTFRKAEVLKGTDGEPLIIPIKEPMTENICTRPFAVDWNGDGQLDLVVGNFTGTFYWFKGEGMGRFDPKAEKIMAGASPLQIAGVHSDPFVIDWDGDGDLDVLSGSSNGGVYWAENRAGKGKLPELTAFQTLIPAGRRPDYGKPLGENELTGPTTSTRIWVDDVNGDGKLDVFVGDSVTLMSYAKGITAEEYTKRQTQWQKDTQAASVKFSSAKTDEERQKVSQEYSKLYTQRAEFVNEEMTGFVWLYLRK